MAGPARAQTREDYCGAAMPRGAAQASGPSRSGHYLNQTYGYSLTLPPGLTGYTGASGPERGITIILSSSPRAFISVDAAYDAFYDITAAGVHRRDLNAIRLHDALLSDQASEATLAGDAGGRFLMRLQCRGATEVALHEELIVLRNREIYRLDLQSTPDRYAGDVQRLNAMLKTWRWEAPR